MTRSKLHSLRRIGLWKINTENTIAYIVTGAFREINSGLHKQIICIISNYYFELLRNVTCGNAQLQFFPFYYTFTTVSFERNFKREVLVESLKKRSLYSLLS